MVKTASILALLLVPVLLLSGRGSAAADSGLIPQAFPPYDSTGKTVLVESVSIRPQPEPGFLMDKPPRLESDVFRAAIVNTLVKTGLFSAVRMHGSADYILSAEIIGQRQLGTLNNIEILLVRYRLTDRQAGRQLWADNLLSHFTLSAEQVFFGIERKKRVLEEAARGNLAQLGERLADTLKVVP